MSTNSHIAIRLREEDRQKTFQTPWGDTIEPSGNEFLYVYCHWDGYVAGVGQDLKNKKFTYEEALQFILEGDRSTIDKSYWEWRQDKDVPGVSPDIEGWAYSEYNYLLDFSKGKCQVYLVDNGDLIKYSKGSRQ